VFQEGLSSSELVIQLVGRSVGRSSTHNISGRVIGD
jgi:hypothetical protein